MNVYNVCVYVCVGLCMNILLKTENHLLNNINFIVFVAIYIRCWDGFCNLNSYYFFFVCTILLYLYK